MELHEGGSATNEATPSSVDTFSCSQIDLLWDKRALWDKLGEEGKEAMDEVMTHLEERGFMKKNSSEGGMDCRMWDPQNSLFFSFTVVTTIGME